MNAAEDYARRWIKREVDQDPELESLSDWELNNSPSTNANMNLIDA
jgi:hypothetical protein